MVSVSEAVIRIFSDIHYGDRMTRVDRLAQLEPLCADIGRLVINGDTFDTRAGPNPAHTERCRAEVAEFFGRVSVPVTFVTGNHDPDCSDQHFLDLADGEVFVIHGDVLYDCIVPWGRDAAPIRRLVREALAALPPGAEHRLDERVGAFRRVAASLRQRHQAERNPVKYTLRFLTDTVWPPPSAWNMLQAWRNLRRGSPRSAPASTRPRARYILVGHTHRPGVWRTPAGVVVINTGSFSPPFGGLAVDLTPTRLAVRRIEARGGAFHPGRTIAEFPLGRTAARAQHQAA